MYWWYCFFIMLAVFSLWTFVETKKLQRRDDRLEEQFWDREREANSVRRKPIDHLDYLHIPDDLPVELLTDNPEVIDIHTRIEGLRSEKILNLTGYSNTDLKIKYGAPNITELSAYDQNYTLLVTTLQRWADLLLEKGYEAEAVRIMEYMVSTRADIGKTYRLLAKYYLANSMTDKYTELISIAGSLKSMNALHIVNSLKEMK